MGRFVCVQTFETKSGGQNIEKPRKNKEKQVFLSFSYVFLVFSYAFLYFSLDFCKGRNSKNTLQMSLKPAKILPLRISSVWTPENAPPFFIFDIRTGFACKIGIIPGEKFFGSKINSRNSKYNN